MSRWSNWRRWRLMMGTWETILAIVFALEVMQLARIRSDCAAGSECGTSM